MTYDQWKTESGYSEVTPEQERAREDRQQRRYQLIKVIRANSSPNMTSEACDSQAQRIADAVLEVPRCADCPARYANGGCPDCDGF